MSSQLISDTKHVLFARLLQETHSPMSKLILCRGLQASGKSTFAENFILESPETRTRINRDNIRHSYYNSYWGESVDENGVTRIEHTIAETIMQVGKRDIVVDNTNFKYEAVLPYLFLAAQHGYEVEFKDFNVELDELLRRDALREKSVGENVIRAYHKKYVTDGRFPPAPVLQFL
jgi:predicted kinase